MPEEPNISTESVLQSVNMSIGMAERGSFGECVPDYSPENVSDTVLRIIQGYVPIINDRVWRKKG